MDGGFYSGGIINRSVRPDNTTRHDVEIQVVQFQENPSHHGDLFPPIPLERTRVTKVNHADGAISRARLGPDTARASFFVSIGNQPELDFGGKRDSDGQGFAVFGRVIEGLDVVEKNSGLPYWLQG